MPSENAVFTPSSILFRPRQDALKQRFKQLGGGAGYRPRVRMAYYKGHLSPYLDCSSPPYIGLAIDYEKARLNLGAK